MTAVCPGCAAGVARPAQGMAPAAAPASTPDPAAGIVLHLPGIHCAGCISGVERTLDALPGVRSARVNLSLKRAFVDTAAGTGPETLVAALAGAGYEAHELDTDTLAASDGADRDLLMRLGVAGFAMMNVLLMSVAVWAGAADSTRQLFHLISAAIAVPAVAFAGRPFYVSALAALRGGHLNMDVPISLAILLATGVSVVDTLAGSGGHAWFDAALSLTFFLLAGRVLDQSGRRAARSAAQALSALDVPRATLVAVGGDRVVATASLNAGDRVRVAPGMGIPVDGRIAEGSAALDRSLLTGESRPVELCPGDAVMAGERLLDRPLVIETTAAGRDTSLARMGRIVAEAETARSRYASLADRAARVYAPAVHLLALAAFLGWYAQSGQLHHAIAVAVAVLVITCPCALGLAVPAVSVAASAKLFRAGLLVKSRTALERLAAIDTVVFDKTGTLTRGQPELVGQPDDAALALAMGLAAGSAHPLSQAIVAAGLVRGLTPAAVTGCVETPGVGIAGTLAGKAVALARPDEGEAARARLTSVSLQPGDGPAMPLSFRDHLRDGASETVAALRGMGLRVVLLSGDAPGPVREIAGRLGIDDFRFGLSPVDKCDVLDQIAAQGGHVLMVGDGLNDAAALARAHASIAPASALDAARAASDLVLLSPSLVPVAGALTTARAALARMRENLWLAAGYNLVAVPLALAGVATPLMAAIAMSASSVTVSLNAARAGR